MNTAPKDRTRGAQVTLYEAVAQLERHYGAALVYAPLRWGTADGTIEYRHTHLYADQMRRQLAGERLHLARAQGIAHGSEVSQRMAREDERIAHGLA